MTIETTAAAWRSDDGMAEARVSTVGRDFDNRVVWQWLVSYNGVVTTHATVPGGEIKSGVGERRDAVTALATLAGFLTAWVEAREYTERGLGNDKTENHDLFPDQAWDFAENYAEELQMELLPWEEE